MKTFSVSRLGAILLALLGLGVFFAAQPASAAVGGATFAVDRATAKPGDQLILTLSLTNTETTDISFAYEYIQPIWPANQLNGAFTVVGCGGDSTDCSFGGNNAAWHFAAPIAPGATRAVTVTVRISDTPTWSGTPYSLNWAPYLYVEYGPAGAPAFTRDQLWADGVPELQTVIG
ncbi:hypothetical protein ABT247_21575 [Kitasatospora sp. NPDC001539]|uniref:hypothetical protein n=1 Tax=Kitasatospora sp. NPDC001539 TaxID=3154384 RepID=UPI0033234191